MSSRQPVPLPVIGLTTYREQAAWGVWDDTADLLPAAYARAVAAAGGVPVLLPAPALGDAGELPTGPDRAAEAVLARLDGLLIAGGADVEPARYEANRHPRTGAARPARDEWELTLARLARHRDLPLLGVCRGLQIINVAFGGDLVQHLPDAVGTDAHCPTPGQFGRHDVTVASGSRLAAIIGPTANVTTYHHQAIGRLGPGVEATAWALDGVVEAIEIPAAAWALGVQWHPEAHPRLGLSVPAEPVIAALVEAARAAHAPAGA